MSLKTHIKATHDIWHIVILEAFCDGSNGCNNEQNLVAKKAINKLCFGQGI
jgi:hypothetical protein